MSDDQPREEVSVVQQRGLYFDEITAGTIYRHAPGRTLTEADNVLFTTLTMNTQSLHLDAHWAGQQPFGRPLVNSMLTLSTMVGASVAQISQGTIVANLGFDTVSFPHPLFHGDTLYTESHILSTRASASRVGQGIVAIKHIGKNQEGTVVAECTRSVMLWMRDHVPGGAQ